LLGLAFRSILIIAIGFNPITVYSKMLSYSFLNIRGISVSIKAGLPLMLCGSCRFYSNIQLVWANSWYDVDIETQSAQTLINQGIKYMGMEASSPAIPQTCQAKGAFCIGYNVDMKDLAPKAVLFSYIWNFAPIFEKIMTTVADGTAKSDAYYYEGGDCASISAFNERLVPKDAQDKVLQAKEDIKIGKINIYGGELKDNKGNVLVPAGETMNDEKINTQEFLVENVIGDLK
jgi:basic membrane protein A and related proteins